MGTKTVRYNKQGINQLPNDKPVLYRIKTESGNLNYVGIAQKGWVRERISEHLKEIPGAKVKSSSSAISTTPGRKRLT